VIAYIDMGWEDLKIALEYDGDHHRSNRRQYVRDQRRIRSLEAMGWIVIRVIAEDNVRDVVARIEAAFRRRGATRD
jgi:very-short-patch-repair endonuclease